MYTPDVRLVKIVSNVNITLNLILNITLNLNPFTHKKNNNTSFKNVCVREGVVKGHHLFLWHSFFYVLGDDIGGGGVFIKLLQKS